MSASAWRLDMEWGQDMPALQWHWEAYHHFMCAKGTQPQVKVSAPPAQNV